MDNKRFYFFSRKLTFFYRREAEVKKRQFGGKISKTSYYPCKYVCFFPNTLILIWGDPGKAIIAASKSRFLIFPDSGFLPGPKTSNLERNTLKTGYSFWSFFSLFFTIKKVP